MKNKITEQEYNDRKAQIEASIVLFKKLEENYIAITLYETNDQDIRDQHGLMLDTINDALYILNNELNGLEDEWSKRNWTYSDHASYNLAVNNID